VPAPRSVRAIHFDLHNSLLHKNQYLEVKNKVPCRYRFIQARCVTGKAFCL
jgi:hypothetical protein